MKYDLNPTERRLIEAYRKLAADFPYVRSIFVGTPAEVSASSEPVQRIQIHHIDGVAEMFTSDFVIA